MGFWETVGAVMVGIAGFVLMALVLDALARSWAWLATDPCPRRPGGTSKQVESDWRRAMEESGEMDEARAYWGAGRQKS